MKREINTTKHEKRGEKKPYEYDAIVVTDEWHARIVKRKKKKKRREMTLRSVPVYTKKHGGGSANMCPLRIE